MTDIMKMQIDPDGKAGHDERECIRRCLNNNPKKLKFTSKNHRMRWFAHAYEDRASLEAVWLPTTCPHYKEGCNFVNCAHCKVNIRGQNANRVRDTNGALLVKWIGEK
jgi:hypothetical protein